MTSLTKLAYSNHLQGNITMIDPHPLFNPMLIDWQDAQAMFDLPLSELPKKVLFFPGGISSVNAELHAEGRHVVSADSAYALNAFEMEKFQMEMLQTCSLNWEREHQDLSIDEKRRQEKIISKWQAIADTFTQDYQKAENEGRYIALKDSLKLPFKNGEFDLVCCPGVLIEDQSTTLNLLKELLRVAHEVRLVPHLLEGEDAHKALAGVMLVLQQEDYGVELRNVNYEAANVMLRVWSKTCVVA